MVQQIINVGEPDRGNGDPLRTAMIKINDNFSEIFAKDAVGSNFDISENTLSAMNTNGNIIFSPNGTGYVIISDQIFPNADGNAGEVLRTDGAGNLYWYAATAVAAGVEGSVQINVAGAINYDPDIKYDVIGNQLQVPNIMVGNITTAVTNQNLVIDPNGTGTVVVTGNATVTQNLLVTGNANISTDANITGNANIGGDVTITGNLTANSINLSNLSVSTIADGNSNVQVAANGNISISVAGISNVVVFTNTGANIAGTANITGNANVGNIGASNAVIVNNVSVTGSGSRIRGDFSNATVSNRTAFMTTTADSFTTVYALPSGTGTESSWQALNNSTPTNASKIQIYASASDMSLQSTRNGSGTYLPLSFYTNNTQQMQIATTGNVSFTATANIGGNLNVTGNIYQNGNLVPNLITVMTYHLAL